ncbi:hypothetical protein KDA_35840 [Dictyobacter alpinus]|uniref:Alpha/beta hydrolase fold-3 domain-containing protein n=1 Tax=Dictyobacter alpinus TaxID=2014873 RepID=A0A402B9W9_9CHLR|nr:alpha/beta hydrolase [Dictyobacter alpinus]GCE28100.1 hypothetical protein KDA_35840 [Dictyobacter alpinus]
MTETPFPRASSWSIITSRRSWQAHVLALSLRVYRVWTRFQSQDLSVQRASQDAFGAHLPLAPNVQFIPLAVGDCPAEWVIPPNALLDRAILYLHGGAYIGGSLTLHRGLVSRIAASSRVQVLNLSYRLAPEHPYPAALEDATSAYQWLLTHGVDAHHLLIAGDSAGGGLAAALLVTLRDSHLPQPAGAAFLSPWTDLSDTERSWERREASDLLLTPSSLHRGALHYLGTHSPHMPLASPVYADLHGLPPLFIQVGGNELLLDDIHAFARHAEEAGVTVQVEEWPGMFHVWQMMAATLPEAQRALEHLGHFIDAVLEEKE